jgi:Tol biopolymer transport system component
MSRPGYRIAGLVVLCLAALVQRGMPEELVSVPVNTCECGNYAPAAILPATSVSTTDPDLLSRFSGTDRKPEMLEPLSLLPLTNIESGRNDSNPQWSPSGMLLAFERSIGDKKEIHIVYHDGTPVDIVYYQLSAGGGDKFFFPGVYEEVSYNADISWSPGGDRFVFMSNGGEGNYDLYVQELGNTAARLTDHKEKDGQAHWSPTADRIVFVSGRTGNGDVYLMDLKTRVLARLTPGEKSYLYPQWSPDGRKIVMMYGSNENHDIVVINDLNKPAASQKRLTTWAYDDLRPIWSPDGRKIAFYSNYNAANDPKIWSLIVINADGTDPSEGDGLAAKVVATDVIPDVETGPAWMPDSIRIVYVRNDRQDYNPLYIADIRSRTSMAVRTDTRMNHDVACSSDGTIAFRAQVNQWDQIYIMKLKK